jgi:hypothetical protein
VDYFSLLTRSMWVIMIDKGWGMLNCHGRFGSDRNLVFCCSCLSPTRTGIKFS